MRLSRYLTVIACVGALAGCGEDDEIDNTRIEREIAAGVEKQTATEDVEIECPDDVEMKKGDVFECGLTAAGGVEARVKVTQTNDEGDVDWEVNP